MLALASCDAEPAPRVPQLEIEPEPPPPAAISGVIVGERDIEEEAPRYYLLPGRLVLIVPVAVEADLWAGEQHAGPSEPPEDDELDRGGRFDPDLLDELGAQLVPGGEDARFVAEVEAGRYLVCLHRDEDVPVVIAGCERIELAPGDTVVVSRGEFGTWVRHHDPDGRTR